MRLEDLENKHKGEIAFVAGAGPSLLNVKPDELYDAGVVISVNSAISKMQGSDYFLADDIGVKNWNYYIDILPKTKAICLLYEDKLKGHTKHLAKERIVFFKHTWWYDPKSKKHNFDGLKMSRSAKDPIIGARTASGSAVHFAYLMGCDPIVLVGCDCCYKQGKRYYWQFPGEEKCHRTTGEPVFCHNNRGMHKGYAVDSHSMEFLDYWGHLSRMNPDVNIIDASDGTMDCFKKMNINELLAAKTEQ